MFYLIQQLRVYSLFLDQSLNFLDTLHLALVESDGATVMFDSGNKILNFHQFLTSCKDSEIGSSVSMLSSFREATGESGTE